jgi:hypothetical protein
VAQVVVEPATFTLVQFDGERIRELVERLAGQIGLPDDAVVRVEVDEHSPLGRTRVTSLDPVVISAESGAFEDAKRPRQLSDDSVSSVVGRLLHRVADRRGPGFADAPPDSDLTLAQHAAWDAYSMGRCARLGYVDQRPRRRYHFRIRHGFTDVADRVFDRLWDGENLTWADIQAASAEALAAKPAAATKARAKAGRTS